MHRKIRRQKHLKHNHTNIFFLFPSRCLCVFLKMQPNKYDLMFVCVGKNGPLRYIGKCVARRFIAVDGVSTEQDLSKLQ